MPVNETFPLDDLRKAMQDYQRITGNRITIEYALFGEVNDSVEHARLLVRYLKGIHVFVNLIPCNSVDGRYQRPAAENILKFRSVLETAGFETEIREELGSDIDAACGQLRRKTKGGEPSILEPAPRTAPGDKGTKKTSRPPKKETAAPKRAGAPSPSVKVADDAGPKRERVGTKPSGGFVDERGSGRLAFDKKRKTDLPPKERYRSGKMKEERPVYRTGTGDGADDRAAAQGERRTRESARGPKRTAATRPEAKERSAPKKRNTASGAASKDKRKKRS